MATLDVVDVARGQRAAERLLAVLRSAADRMGLRGASDLKLLDWLLAELRELGDDRVRAVQALREHRTRRARSGALQ